VDFHIELLTTVVINFVIWALHRLWNVLEFETVWSVKQFGVWSLDQSLGKVLELRLMITGVSVF